MKLLVLGSRGMLGTRVVDIARKDGHIVVEGFGYNICSREDMSLLADGSSIVINCAGVIPARHKPDSTMVATNAWGPHVVADVFAGQRIIHVSTDCVFDPLSSETMNRVTERPSPTTLYGRSKLAGEVEGVVNIRTSFIGPEHGLLAWLLVQSGAVEVEGWLNARWSGATVWEVARRLVQIAGDPSVKPGVHHLATQWPTSKYQLIVQINTLLRLGLKVVPVTTPIVNRALEPTLSMKRGLNELLDTVGERRSSGRA